jgi:hypothetical protein
MKDEIYDVHSIFNALCLNFTDNKWRLLPEEEQQLNQFKDLYKNLQIRLSTITHHLQQIQYHQTCSCETKQINN